MSNDIAMGSLNFNSLIITSVVTLVAWTLYIALRRLALSPIAGVPGPKLAALTTMYAAYYDVFYPAQYVLKIKELHGIYGGVSSCTGFRLRLTELGPIVHVAPNEVHVNDVEFLDPIYNPPSRSRNKYLPNLKGLPLDQSVGAAKNWEIHRKRREALNPFFSHKRVLDTEALINGKVREFCCTLDDLAGSGRILNMSDMYFALALEYVVLFSLSQECVDLASIVRKYSFGQDQDVLANPEEANRL
jgi:hypothetical protein